MGEKGHLVFAYGTLRKHQYYHGLLEGSERLAEQCWTAGRLYDTGYGYPALVEDDEGRVYGEVYRVTDEVLARLDELEGYFGPGRKNEYDRVIHTVHGDKGTWKAYVYVYGRLQKHMPEIAEGDWSVYTWIKGGRGGHEGSSLLYFAYGSCMDEERIRQGGAWERFQGYRPGERKTRAVLENYRLAFTAFRSDGGRADIVECPGEKVEGILYRIDDAAWSYLLGREGAWPINGGQGRPLYRPTLVDVAVDGERVPALTFTVVDKQEETAPPLHYVEEIIRGAQGILSPQYLVRFKTMLKAKFGLDTDLDTE